MLARRPSSRPYRELVDKNGCTPKEYALDDCCNPGRAGPTWNGTACCYRYCEEVCCGRPFVVAGRARVAEVLPRPGWADEEASPADLADIDRVRIARACANDAAMEHASVASFVRFVLDLLSVGAPHGLVEDAQRAMRDEIAHARACFTIASSYAGRALGPAPLDVRGAAPGASLPAIAAAAAFEGRIGETLSAALARARARGAADADTRRTLETIAEDETRHAELAWRFVGWALSSGDPAVRDAVEEAFEDVRMPEAFDGGLRGISASTLRAHGLLDEVAARKIVARVAAEVLSPCIRHARAA